MGGFPLCLVANCVCWFGFLLGPGPVLLLFRCCFLWRNANLAGGFAGRLFLFVFFVVDCFFVTYCTAGTTAFQSTRFNSFLLYTNYRTEPRSDIGQTRKKKSQPNARFLFVVSSCGFCFLPAAQSSGFAPLLFFVFGLLPFSFFAYFCLFRCSFCLSPLVCFAPSSYGLVSCGGMVEHPPYVGRCGSRVASQYPPVRSLLLICLLSRRAWSSFCGIARYGAWYLCQAACTHGFGPVWGSLSTPCGVSWCPLLMTLQRWSVHGLCMVCTYIDPIITLSLATAANPSVLPCKHSLALVPYWGSIT